MSENTAELRSLALTPTWSVATVLTIFVAVSLLVERSIHWLGNWLKKTDRKPLLAAVEKMKEELMLLGFISLLLTATSSIISNICIPSKFYDGVFAPCSKREVDEERENNHLKEGRLLMTGLNRNTCGENYEPFVSYEGLEQLHRFIFVMAVTHISYSCLTMLLAIVKIHSWRAWENEAHMDRYNTLSEITKALTMRRQSTFVRVHTSNPMDRNRFLVWVTCFFRQFGKSVVRADYLSLRQGFFANHNLPSTYDFHSYMIRSMEEEFHRIVGVSAPLWGFVVAFMLFNIKGSNLYFWIALIPVTVSCSNGQLKLVSLFLFYLVHFLTILRDLVISSFLPHTIRKELLFCHYYYTICHVLQLVLLVGTKLQHVIATLALESAGISASFSGLKFKLRDELFWFNKPELLLSLIHFILFQNAFELASFFWFWWQFGYNSCFIKNHLLVYIRIIVGFSGQFLCSYSTLPLYALVTQMGTNYKAALLPKRIRETIHGWGREARRRRRHGHFTDDSTVHTDTSTFASVEEDDTHLPDSPIFAPERGAEIELQPHAVISIDLPVADQSSNHIGTPLFWPSASVSSPSSLRILPEMIPRSSSMPR